MSSRVQNTSRSTQEVLDHHLEAFGSGDLEEVLKDYTEQSILIEPNASHQGIDGLRTFFASLFSGPFEPGSYDFTMDRCTVEGDVAYIVWHAEGRDADVPLGTDTFVIRDGKFAVHTFAGKIDEA